MFLAVDIGNTSITLGLFVHKKLKRKASISTHQSATKIEKEFSRLFKRSRIERSIICSVVPKKTAQVKRAIERVRACGVLIVGKDIKVPMRNLYTQKSQVGKDRLLAGFASREIYGAPTVVIDFGTAITFDYVNKEGEYEGGIIAPGIEISLDALYKKAALLPKIVVKNPKTFVGKSTKESILSGVSFGLSSMCDGVVTEFKKSYGKKIKVVATGGLANFFKDKCKQIDIVDNSLILKGLSLLGINGDGSI